MEKVIIVTGSSSGIGYELVKYLVSLGHIVYGLARTHTDIGGAICLQVDITDHDKLKDAVDSIYEENGRIDVVINNAGMGISGAIEFTDVNDVKRLFDVNYFAMVDLNSMVIEKMRENGCGRIVNISSVASICPIPFQSFYSASKASVDSYSMALDNEVSMFGIRSVSVRLGDTKTGFTSHREKSIIGDDIYKGKITKGVSKMEKDEQSGISSEKTAKYIGKIALKKNVKPIYTMGAMYKLIGLLVRILPSSVVNKLIKLLYT